VCCSHEIPYVVKRLKVKVKKSGRNLEIAWRAVYTVSAVAAIYFLVIIQMAVVAGSHRAYSTDRCPTGPE